MDIPKGKKIQQINDEDGSIILSTPEGYWMVWEGGYQFFIYHGDSVYIGKIFEHGYWIADVPKPVGPNSEYLGHFDNAQKAIDKIIEWHNKNIAENSN